MTFLAGQGSASFLHVRVHAHVPTAGDVLLVSTTWATKVTQDLQVVLFRGEVGDWQCGQSTGETAERELVSMMMGWGSSDRE